MGEPHLTTADQVDAGALAAFLRARYPGPKSEFLIAHGAWWHGSDLHRLVVLVEGEIAGYCAVIPARVWVGGRELPALWWVDLVIAPPFRGRGLQTLFDRRVREMADLLLGFPNELAAKIHRKHGWGVREDLHITLLPLRPAGVKPVQSAGGLVKAAARLLSPLAAAWRGRLARARVTGARRVGQPDAALLAGVYRRSLPLPYNTTCRDEAFFEWRYFSAPQPEEYAFFTAGDPATPSHYLIIRHMRQGALRFSRILDVFGDLRDGAALRGLLTLAVQDALARGSAQVTLLAGCPELRAAARRLGFWIATPFGFCWRGDRDAMAALAQDNYWTLGDSDNDAPD
jgi:GNAT superfamily N-acetyltransferase